MSPKPQRITPGTTGRILAALLGLALLPPIAWGDEPVTKSIVLSVDTHRILFPPVSEQTLDNGRVAMDPAPGAYAVRIELNPPDENRAWVLYLRADASIFRSEGHGKSCRDLWWKFDHEGRGAYRPVEDRDAVVLESRGGGNAYAVIDLLLDLDWSTTPGIYALGLVFTLVCE